MNKKIIIKGTTNDNINLDIITRFMLNGKEHKGKIVRLGLSLDDILSKHKYPKIVSQILAELLVVVSMLGNNLKNDGKVTCQIQSDGAVDLVIADYFDDGKIRGYARFDKDKIKELEKKKDPRFDEIVGKGHLAITYNFGKTNNPFQGIVELKGKEIKDSIAEYFKASEQIKTNFKISAKAIYHEGKASWFAGGVLIQDLPKIENKDTTEKWHETEIFMETISDQELLDSNLPLNELLLRLFHEDGVWSLDTKEILHGCSCSREKAEDSLKNLTHEELEEIRSEGKIIVTCQFCSKEEKFD